jgi:hypothetical protein
MDESDSQRSEHNEPRISTLPGITIDWSDDPEDEYNSIRINREVDSNKWMKVIYNKKNMMRPECQHCSESQLIKVMNMKMLTIQFALIVNLIQMKWMKVIYTIENMMNQQL